MKSEPLSGAVRDLHWLAFLLTGRRDLSIDIAVDAIVSQDSASPYFATWMSAWSRRLVLAKALGAVRGELTESARRTKHTSVNRETPSREWSLSRSTSKADIEEALLAIDLLPRAAVVLLTFEGVALADAAALLDADAALIAKAHAIGLREFVANLAWKQGYTVPKQQSFVQRFCMKA